MAVWERLPGLVSDLKLRLRYRQWRERCRRFGITEDIFLETISAGADRSDHRQSRLDQKEAVVFCERHDQFLRPGKLSCGTPGRGSNLFFARNGARVLVANVMGRVFMHPELDDPFKTAETIPTPAPLGEQADAVVFDFHAEATSEKQCFGHFVDGRASLVVGTHTHVPTADHQILNGGTGYMSDAGMCGDYDSSLGMDKEEPLNRFISKMPKGRFERHRPGDICGRRDRDFGPDGAGGKDRAAQDRPAPGRDDPAILGLSGWASSVCDPFPDAGALFGSPFFKGDRPAKWWQVSDQMRAAPHAAAIRKFPCNN